MPSCLEWITSFGKRLEYACNVLAVICNKIHQHIIILGIIGYHHHITIITCSSVMHTSATVCLNGIWFCGVTLLLETAASCKIRWSEVSLFMNSFIKLLYNNPQKHITESNYLKSTIWQSKSKALRQDLRKAVSLNKTRIWILDAWEKDQLC